jgi:hypothetical protein
MNVECCSVYLSSNSRTNRNVRKCHIEELCDMYNSATAILPLYSENATPPASIVEIVVTIQIATRKIRTLNINCEVKPGIL